MSVNQSRVFYDTCCRLSPRTATNMQKKNQVCFSTSKQHTSIVLLDKWWIVDLSISQWAAWPSDDHLTVNWWMGWTRIDPGIGGFFTPGNTQLRRRAATCRYQCPRPLKRVQCFLHDKKIQKSVSRSYRSIKMILFVHIKALWIMWFGCIQPICHYRVADYFGYTPKATKQSAGQPSIHWLICMMSGLDKTTTQRSGDVKVFCVSVDGKMTGGHEYEKLLESVGELHSILEITCWVWVFFEGVGWLFCYSCHEIMNDSHMKSKLKEDAQQFPDVSCHVVVCHRVCVCVFSLRNLFSDALEMSLCTHGD